MVYASEKNPTCFAVDSMSSRSDISLSMNVGKKVCHQYPAREKLGSSRASVHSAWLAWPAARKHWKRMPGCRATMAARRAMVCWSSLLAVSYGRGSAPREKWYATPGRRLSSLWKNPSVMYDA